MPSGNRLYRQIIAPQVNLVSPRTSLLLVEHLHGGRHVRALVLRVGHEALDGGQVLALQLVVHYVRHLHSWCIYSMQVLDTSCKELDLSGYYAFLATIP